MLTFAPRAASAPAASSPALATASPYRPGAARVAALVDVPGVGFLTISDTLTGYGRTGGYESLANARRAAFQLTVGAASPAAGIYRTGDRYFVRALSAVAGRDPHAPAAPGAPGAPAPAPTASLLHFEGRNAAHFAWVSDPRLVAIVDGATRVWSKDAHHAPPKG